MLQISSIEGNVFHDKRFEPLADQDCETVCIPRSDLEKNRLRCVTDRGTEIGVALEYGTHLHDGDVLTKDGRYFVVRQMPEKVITVRVTKPDVETTVLLGHIIGNRHRPISIEGEAISFPIQAESEMDTFRGLLAQIIGKIEITSSEKVFKPHLGADTHEH